MKIIEVTYESRPYSVPVKVCVQIGTDLYKDIESFRLRFYRALGLVV